jgi:hypothetical protein
MTEILAAINASFLELVNSKVFVAALLGAAAGVLIVNAINLKK